MDKDAPVVYDTEIISKHGKQKGQRRPMLMTAKKKKRPLSTTGDIIPDSDTVAIQDMMEGKKILSYREEQQLPSSK